MTQRRLLAEILAGPVLDAAPALLGARMRSRCGGEITEVVITEVEAYGGVGEDPASHAHRGKTARNASMFASPGTAYVYRSYGVHWMLNIAVGPSGAGSAVLLRAGTPVDGIAVMERRRGRARNLADGPGKLAQALGVTGDQDGTDLLADGELALLPGDPPGVVVATPRIGITRAVERPWRFVVAAPVGAG